MILYEAEVLWFNEKEEVIKTENKLIEAKDEKEALNKVSVVYGLNNYFNVWSPSRLIDMKKSNWLSGGFFNKLSMPDQIMIRKPNIIK